MKCPFAVIQFSHFSVFPKFFAPLLLASLLLCALPAWGQNTGDRQAGGPNALGYAGLDSNDPSGIERAGEPAEPRYEAYQLNTTASDAAYTDRVAITWDDQPDETGYEVYRDGILLATLGANAAEYNDTLAPAGSTPTYCVDALDSNGSSYLQACDTGSLGALTATDGVFEDRVELNWPGESLPGSLITIERDGVALVALARTVTSYTDETGDPGTDYTYCVKVENNGAERTPVCTNGSRRIFPPTGFAATDGTLESEVLLTWNDKSSIEDGYVLTRSGGQSLDLDGTDDYIETTTPVDLSGSFTIAFRARRTRTGLTEAVISHGASPSYEGFQIAFSSSDRLIFWFRDDVLQTTTTFTDTNWHHYVVTYDAATRARQIFVDGVLQGSDVSAQAYVGTGPLFLGRLSWGSTNFFAGGLDEVRVSNKVRTQPEFDAPFPVADAATLHFWRLDAASGPTAVDAVGSNHGMLMNMDDTDWVAPAMTSQSTFTDENVSFFRDTAAEPGVTYSYALEASTFFEQNEFRTPALSNDGWRGFVMPPAQVAATDGQFTDRVRVTWLDQSTLEAFYTVYRYAGTDTSGTPTTLGQVTDPDQAVVETLQFDDLTAVANTPYTYCVGGTTDGKESVLLCDAGMRSGLEAPTNVVATDNTLDDRVKLDWDDVALTEDGFRILRDGTLIDTTGPNAETYSDYTAAQGVTYTYCVQAVSNADPQNPSTSVQVCDTGTRSNVLAPENVTATDNDFEQWVTINWTNPSTTATLFKVLRDGTLIDTVPFTTTTHVDEAIESDVTYEYCVVSVTLVQGTAAMRDEVAGLLTSLRASDARPRVREHGDLQTDTERATRLYQAALEASAMGLEESAPVCDNGSRSLKAPSDVAATFDEHEDRIEITWKDNATGEKGYNIYRSPGPALLLDGTDDYVEIPAASAFNVTTAFTIEAWINVPDVNTFDQIMGNTDANNLGGYGLGISEGKLTALAWLTDDPFIITGSGGTLSNDTWTHVAATWASGDALRLYINGVEVASEASVATTVGVSQEPMGLGIVEGNTFALLQGKIDEARIWNVVRTPAELMATMNLPLQGNEPGLVAYWPLQEGAGTTTSDLANGNDGTLMGGAAWTSGSPSGAGSLVGSVSATRTSFGDYTSVPGTTHTYDVRAFDTYGMSKPDSDTGRRTLGAPTGLRASDGTSETTVSLTWNDNARAETGYDVLRNDVLLHTTATNATAYQDATGAINTNYTYKVRARDDYGTSVAIADTGKTAILPPSDVNASEVYEDKVVISWVNNSQIDDAIWIYRDASLIVQLPDPTTATYTDLSAVAGTTYTYCVVARKGSEPSARTCDQGMRRIPPTPAIGFTPELVVEGSNVGAFDNFGQAVAIDGDWAVIGAPDTDTFNNGAVYFYQRNGAQWEQRDIATPPVFTGAQLGEAVDISGEYAILGAPFDRGEGGAATTKTGAAYIYELKGSTWQQVQKLAPTDGSDFDAFGSSVAIDGEWALVGSPRWDIGASLDLGRATMFKRGSDGTWAVSQTLISGSQVGAGAGTSVSINSDWAVVGSPGVDDNGRTNNGSFSLFKYQGGDIWQFQGGFVGLFDEQQVGYAVSMGEDRVAVGAPGDTSCSGSASEEDRDAAVFALQAYNAPNATPSSTGQLQHDGLAAAIRPESPQQADASARQRVTSCGALYIYERQTDDSWTSAGSLIGSDTEEELGEAVAIAGDNAIAGGTPLNDAMTVKALSYVDGAWRRSDPATYVGFDRVTRSNFLAISNNWIMIGADRSFNAQGVQTGTVMMSAIAVPPTNVAASDGLFEDRIQITWTDLSEQESGFKVYRRDADGTLKVVGTTSAEAEAYEDFSAAPGGSYEYCVASFTGLKESTTPCDTGWRPTNGALSGRIASRGGGGTKDVEVCLAPSANRALLFDGTGGYVSVPHIAKTNEMTVCAWVQPAGTTAQEIVAWASNSGDDVIEFRVQPDGRLFYGEWDGATWSPVQSSALLRNGMWNHVCAVKNGGNVQLYINGLPDGSGTSVDRTTNTSTLTIGGWERSGVFDLLFAGQIDDVQLWNTARTQAQIQASMTTPLSGQEDGLMGYWNFDEGTRNVAADLSGGGNNGLLSSGTYWTDEGAPLNDCATTDVAGNYTLSGVRYGESTKFTVTPKADRRSFSPPFKTITLNTDNPIQNEVGFTDNTAFTVKGTLTFEAAPGCPVPDADLYVTEVRSGVAEPDVLKGTSQADGTYAVSVDPSIGADDLRRITPRLENPEDPGDFHVFTPANRLLFVDSDQNAIDFVSTKTRTFSGFFGSSCGFNIGTATLLITTENGCYEQEVATNPDGSFDLALAPQKYLVQVKDVDSPLRADVLAFFDAIGAQEIDLTQRADTLDLIYRAPLKISFTGFPTPPATCPANEFTQLDEDGNVVRTLGVAPLVNLGDKLTIGVAVNENYGDINGVPGDEVCPATAGSLTIYDGIAEVPEMTFDLSSEEPIEYETIVGAPNVFAGARVDGIDRSFQKSFSAVAEVAGQDAATETQWVFVQGARPRTGTFVTIPSEPIPMFALHDPPGDNSYSFIETGSTMCKGMQFEEALLIGLESEIKSSFGFEFISGTAFGGLFAIVSEVGGGPVVEISGGVGGIFERGYTVCMTTKETFQTSADPDFVGPDADVFVGLGMNFTFSEADKLTVDDQCVLAVNDILGVGVDLDDPIHTTYSFTRGLLRDTMIPQLEENAARETGAAQVEQRNAANRWEQLLAYDAALGEEDAFNLVINHSFAAGADVNKSVTYTRNDYDNKGFQEELNFAIGTEFDTKIAGSGVSVALKGKTEFQASQVFTSEEESEFVIGYVLADDDAGDFFTVDVGQSNCRITERSRDDFSVDCSEGLDIEEFEKPPFAPGGEMLFRLRSGTSSNPWEPITQKRDRALLSVNPPERNDLRADDTAVFTLTLTNAGESQEERDYTLQTVHTSNPGGAVLTAQGSPIHDGLDFTIGAQQAQEVTLAVERGPNVYNYPDLKVKLFPKDDPQDALSAEVMFDVAFNAPCSDISISRPRPDWMLNAASVGAGLDVILREFRVPVSEADSVTKLGLEYRRVGAGDETGNVWLPAVNVGINRTGPVEPDSLARDATSWESTWTVSDKDDGTYEIRAFTECLIAGPAEKVFSDPMFGLVDTKLPQVLTTPEPGDRVLALGDDIAVTFDEPLDCSSVVTSGTGINTTLSYYDDTMQGDAIAIIAVCDGRSVVLDLDPSESLTWPDLEGHLLKVDMGTAVTDVAGNPLTEAVSWTFTVRRSAVTWNPSALVADVPYRSVVTLTADLVNGREEEAPFVLSSTWLPFTPAGGTLEAGGQQTIGFTLTGTLEPGTYADTVRAAVTVGSEVLDIALPVAITVVDYVQQPVALAQGWTWFSINREPTATHPDSVLASLNPQGGDLLKSQTAFSLFDFASGSWLGALGAVEAGPSYQVKLGQAATLLVGGPEINPTTPVTVTPGWTWLGYLPQVAMPLGDALASLPATGPISQEGYLGDLIKSQFAFAQYDGSAWTGSLTEMKPGLGYMLQSRDGGTLTYPAPSAPATVVAQTESVVTASQTLATTTQEDEEEGSRLAQKEARVVRDARAQLGRREGLRASAEHAAQKRVAQHPFSMTLTGQLMLDGQPMTAPGTLLRARVGDEVRGVAPLQYLDHLQTYRVFLLVYGTGQEAGEVTLEVYDPSTDRAYELEQTLPFAVNGVHGTPVEPVTLAAETEAYKAARAAEALPQSFALEQNYPNPFNPVTLIHYDLPEATHVSLTVFDVLGRKVRTLVESTQKAGRYDVRFDAHDLASGLYFYQIEAGSFKEVRRMMLLK